MDSAEWPSVAEVPQAARQLVGRFFSLLDNDGSDVGDILADEIFTADAVAYFGGQPSTGSEEIRVSRTNAWEKIETRRHKVLRVYVTDSDASDLLFIAHVAMGLRNGKQVDGQFVGRLVIADPQTSSPRLRLYQVWGDSSALVKALQS